MSSYLEERLREAAALGNLEEVRMLVRNGVALNAQNEVNGWTCLHWACKRNQTHIVKYLLDHGADKGILTKNGDLAAHLTSKKEIGKLLGAPEMESGDNQEVNNLKLLSMANCLINESFSGTYNEKGDGATLVAVPAKENNAAIPHLSAGDTSLCLSRVQAENNGMAISLHKETEFPGKHFWVEELISSVVAEATEDIKSRIQSFSASSSSSTHLNRDNLTSCPSMQRVPNQKNSATGEAVSVLQPLLFNGTFPCNMHDTELVLKVRVQNPKEYDFIEIELDRKQLTYQDLLNVCCCELGINSEQVEKIRKLPNTLLRKDEDVARLQNFQELELVLARSIASSLRNDAVTTLVEKTCYNIKAANLIY
ncbi:ankyrin repeat domain-containing protein 40-like isoform X2 [Erythrolamprus reginae]|uniref:ankyrin repeat domain-containing protein 40-like isoform X2 n=1 Tax=Erythrolamprus reginae TaxID=121349 RepID=UPI00396CCA44